MEGKYKGLILISIIIIVFLILSINIGLNKERIDIAGSTSVQPLGEELANSYSSMHPYLQINVQGGGSAMGIRSASQKIADIGMSSKELSDTEKEGLNIIELGKEGIVVGVYKNNTIDDLSIEELKKIFSGEITNWKELGGADEEIHVISREDGSGTRSSFERIVMGDLDIRKDAIIQSSTEAVKQSISSDPGAIGYISLAHMSDDVKSLKIGGIDPSEENIANGKYELQTPFLFITSKNPSKEVKEFLVWIKSPKAIEIIKSKKIVPTI